MAAVLKEFEFPLSGVFRSETRKLMVEEFTKLMIYQKKMIPLQYDLLKKDVKSKADTPCDTEGQKVRNKASSNVAEKKKAQFVDAIQKLFYFFDEAFTLGGPVKQVLFVIGSNTFTAKETYSVVFPIGYYEGKTLTDQECKSALFRNLVTSEVFTESQKAAGEILIYLKAPQNCAVCVRHFDPKPELKLPTKGYHYYWKYVSEAAEADHSWIGEEEFNISGIEALATPREDAANHMDTRAEHTPNSTKRARKTHIFGMREAEVKDYIWFQIPLQIKKLKF